MLFAPQFDQDVGSSTPVAGSAPSGSCRADTASVPRSIDGM